MCALAGWFCAAVAADVALTLYVALCEARARVLSARREWATSTTSEGTRE